MITAVLLVAAAAHPWPSHPDARDTVLQRFPLLRAFGASTWARWTCSAGFRRYLDAVFMWAGSASLARSLTRAPDPARPAPGDVFLQGGSPGHVVLVLDVAEDSSGHRFFLLAQSYTPAQEIHVLNAPSASSPWYDAADPGDLITPEWTFARGTLRRFEASACP